MIILDEAAGRTSVHAVLVVAVKKMIWQRIAFGGTGYVKVCMTLMHTL